MPTDGLPAIDLHTDTIANNTVHILYEINEPEGVTEVIGVYARLGSAQADAQERNEDWRDETGHYCAVESQELIS